MNRDLEGYKTRFQNALPARKYAERFAEGGRKRASLREQRAVEQIFAGLNGCHSVLDVPSGAGRFIAALGERRVIELDVAREILDLAREQALALGRRTEFVQADAARLPFAADAVDAILCNRLLHHILPAAERAIILRELHRVVRRYVVLSFFDYHSFGFLRRILKKLQGRRPTYGLQPSYLQFSAEVFACGFRIKELVPTGPMWVAQHFMVLEKVQTAGNQAYRTQS